MVRNSDMRRRFVQNSLKFVQDHNFDGLGKIIYKFYQSNIFLNFFFFVDLE